MEDTNTEELYKEELQKLLPNCTDEDIDELVQIKMKIFVVIDEKDFT